MNFDFEIYRLSAEFTNDYPYDEYPELLRKSERPYHCLLIDCHCDYFIAVPFRSEISHRNAYLFKNSKRSKQKRSGLDYTKIVIVKDNKYLDDKNVVVDKDEYQEAVIN